jgi:ABC-type dipeptide/oligopeptide/nickel transport systems, permease components
MNLTQNDFVRRLLTNRLSGFGFVLLLAIILAVVFGPLIWTVDPTAQNLAERIAPPSAAHPLGTDSLGRDVLSRILYGGRTTLLITFTAVLLSGIIGAAIGLIAGYFGGAIDAVLMRINDVLLALPFLLLALMISVALGPGVVNTAIALTIPAIPRDARLVRAAVLSVKQGDYVFAARASGVRPRRIITHHVLRNISSGVLMVMSVGVAYSLLAVAGLGFLGLGVQPPAAEWGAMLTDGRMYIISNPVVVLVPGLAIMLTALAANLVGDAFRDAFDVSV